MGISEIYTKGARKASLSVFDQLKSGNRVSANSKTKWQLISGDDPEIVFLQDKDAQPVRCENAASLETMTWAASRILAAAHSAYNLSSSLTWRQPLSFGNTELPIMNGVLKENSARIFRYEETTVDCAHVQRIRLECAVEPGERFFECSSADVSSNNGQNNGRHQQFVGNHLSR